MYSADSFSFRALNRHCSSESYLTSCMFVSCLSVHPSKSVIVSYFCGSCQISRKCSVRIWTAFDWLRIRDSVMGSLVSIKHIILCQMSNYQLLKKRLNIVDLIFEVELVACYC